MTDAEVVLEAIAAARRVLDLAARIAALKARVEVLEPGYPIVPLAIPAALSALDGLLASMAESNAAPGHSVHSMASGLLTPLALSLREEPL